MITIKYFGLLPDSFKIVLDNVDIYSILGVLVECYFRLENEMSELSFDGEYCGDWDEDWDDDGQPSELTEWLDFDPDC